MLERANDTQQEITAFLETLERRLQCENDPQEELKTRLEALERRLESQEELKTRLEALERRLESQEELKTRLEALERRLETAEGCVRQLVKHVRREKARSKWPERDRSGLLSPQNDDDPARFTMPAIQRDPQKGSGRARRVP